MTFLGLSLEDLLAIVSIGGVGISVLIWGFKKAFHSVYETESRHQQQLLSKLIDTVDDFSHIQGNLNETITELKRYLKESNKTLRRHEVRLTVLEEMNKADNKGSGTHDEKD